MTDSKLTELAPVDARSIATLAARVFDDLDVSEATRADYSARLSVFFDYLGRCPIGPETFLGFKRFLEQRTDLAVSTKNKYLVAARRLLQHLHARGYVPVDVTADIKAFRQSRKHKRMGVTDADMDAVIALVRELPATPAYTRLRALLALLSLQGLRQIEVSRLDVTNLDLPNHRVFVRGKGRNDTEPVSLHPETVKAIREYLRTNKLADGPLFVGRSNNSTRLTTRGLRLIVSDTLKKAGVDKTVHGFRHYFVTRLIKAYKGDLLQVAEYTRHQSLEMLRVYNDNIRNEADLPRFHKTFAGVRFEPEK